MMMKKKHQISIALSAALAATALLLGAGSAMARSNPVDAVTNPDKLPYADVNMRRPDFDEPFQRDGVIEEPKLLQVIGAGTTADEVRAALGAPLKRGDGKKGPEWDYNLKFKMPRSANYLVCQYKVVLDEQEKAVTEAVWRRKQCQDIVQGVN